MDCIDLGLGTVLKTATNQVVWVSSGWDAHAFMRFSQIRKNKETHYCMGVPILTFIYIASDVVGRNYFWGVMRLYEHMQRCNSIDEATKAAITWMQKGESIYS